MSIHTFLLGLLIFLTAPLSAPPPDPLPYTIEWHLYFARFAEARATAEAAVQDRAAAPQSPGYAVALSELGRVRTAFAKYPAADSLLTAALSLLESQNATADSTYLKTCRWAAENCRSLAQFARAETILNLGMLAADAVQNTPHESFRAGLLLEYAALDAELSRFQQAGLHYTQAVEALEKAFGKNSPKVATALTDWGNFENGSTRNFKSAEAKLARAMQILTPIARQYPLEYLSALTAQARLYSYGVPRYRESRQMLEKAVEFGEKHLGAQHTSLAWTLRVLAGYHQDKTAYFYRADTLNRQALAIYEGHFGRDYPGCVGALQDISGWYGSLGYAQKAAEVRQEAFERIRKIYGDRHPETADLMLAFAQTQKNAGNMLQADSLLRQVDTLYRTFYGDQHTTRITMLREQASFVSSQQNYPAADSLSHLALAAEERLNGRGSFHWWTIISSISTLAWASDNPTRADSLLRAKMLFDKTQYGENSLQYARDWWELFFVYNSSASKKHMEAEKAVRQYLLLTEKAIGGENDYYLDGLQLLSTTLIKQRRFEEAEKVLQQREALARKIFGEKSKAMTDVLNERIDLIETSGPPSEAIGLREQALVIRKEMGDMVGYIWGLSGLSSALTNLGQYAAADSVTQEQLILSKKQYGTANGNYFVALINAVFLYEGLSEYQKAKYYLDSSAVVNHLIGGQYSDLLDGVMVTYLYQVGQYKEAAQLAQKNIDREPDIGSYNQYGRVLIQLGQYARADSILHIALSKAKDSPDFETTIYLNIAENLDKWDRKKEAFEFTKKGLEAAKKAYGENHPDYGIALNSYAGSLQSLGRYDEAEAAYKKTLEIIARNEGADHPEYATSLENLGLLYWELGRHQEAETLTLQALKIREQKLGSDHPDCAFSRLRLADVYSHQMWKPLEADSLLRLVMDYWKNRAPQSRQYADALVAQGKFLTYVGEFEKAAQRINQAKDIYKIAIADQCWEVSNCLNELGLTYVEASKQVQGSEKHTLLQKSLANLKGSIAIERNLYGTDRLNYATFLNNIGAVYYRLPNADSVVHYMLRSLEVRKKLQGEQNASAGGCYSSLSGAYEMQGKYPEAETAGRKALTILSETTGKETEDYMLCARGMGSILLATGRPTEALAYLEEYRKAALTKIKKAFGYLSSTEQIKMIRRYRPDFYYSAALQYRHPELARMSYNNALLFKGAGLHNKRSLRDLLYASKDTVQLKLYDRYLSAEKSIAAEYNLPVDQRTRLDSLQNASRDLERDLIASSPDYRAYIAQYNKNWQAVQVKLQPGDAAIEFVRYNLQRVIDTDTFLYAALVLLPGRAAPVFVPLCAENDIDTLQYDHTRLRGFPSSMYTPQELSRATPIGKNFNFYQKIWQPLDSLLNGVRRIYFSPDGLLHRISFAALGYSEKGEYKYLYNRFELIQLASTRQLAEPAPPIAADEKEVLVVGEIDYGKFHGATLTDPTATLGANDPFAGFGPLESPGEISEFGAAGQKFKAAGYKVSTLSGREATERGIVSQLARKKPYRAVCLITHGFFLPDTRFKQNMRHLYAEVNPMQRSGLVFAGINEVDSMATPANDGILTAQDFAGMNLQGTEVVAITACQSGLGDISSSEGVFGLQRAFREAGARYLIISLWDLPNYRTRDFMKTFYELWLDQNLPVPEAFRETRKKMSNTPHWTPEDWGGLILIE